jgi:general secretion pathway protein G
MAGFRTRLRRWGHGFTILELMLGLAIAAILIIVGMGQYGDYEERVRVSEAINDINAMSLSIWQMNIDDGKLPASLAEAGHAGALDPWGRPYIYTDLTGPGNGAARKDRRLNPLNSDFDLFSKGKDGVFKPQISHRDSLDDVIRASDGRFVNLAHKY